MGPLQLRSLVFPDFETQVSAQSLQRFSNHSLHANPKNGASAYYTYIWGGSCPSLCDYLIHGTPKYIVRFNILLLTLIVVDVRSDCKRNTRNNIAFLPRTRS